MNMDSVLRRFLDGRRPPAGRPVPARKPSRKHLWSIGVYFGTTLSDLHPGKEPANPVLTRADITDVRASFVADPFMVHASGMWHMFFEVYNDESHKGEIGLAVSANGSHWEYQRIVLSEHYHLSYPCVFRWDGENYMIPESRAANSIRLYRSSRFPSEWEFVHTLVTGPYGDATIFRYHGKWWMFADSRESMQINNTLRLFSSDLLMGPWKEHPRSPIIAQNPHLARPGGRVIMERNPIRFTQDCYPVYGTRLRAFEITRLTETEYEERSLSRTPFLAPGGNEWNQAGMHHVDPHRLSDGSWIACVDGFRWEEVGPPAAK